MESSNSGDGLEKFGRFYLRRRLGAGGMAEVFLAEMTGLDGYSKLVALKRMHPEISDNAQFRASFIQEARVGGSLNHPNIVQTLDLGIEGKHHYLALELVEGITLATFIKFHQAARQPIATIHCIDIAKQLCDGLAYAHAAKNPRGQPLHMVHRDLKPANVLLSHFGQAKITDFGIVRSSVAVSESLTGQAVKGTVAYMSPEQARGDPLDHRSDLFALGAILFEVLTLEPLFPNARGLPGLFDVMRADFDSRLPLLGNFTDPLVEIIRSLLQKNRDDRPANAQSVRQSLERVGLVLHLQGEALASVVTRIMGVSTSDDTSIGDRSLDPGAAAVSDADTARGAVLPIRLPQENPAVQPARLGYLPNASFYKNRLWPPGIILRYGVILLAIFVPLLGYVAFVNLRDDATYPREARRESQPLMEFASPQPSPIPVRSDATESTAPANQKPPIEEPIQARTANKSDNGAKALKEIRDSTVPALPVTTAAARKSTNLTANKDVAESRPFGTLSVNARPWAAVYLDGKLLKESTPVLNERIPVGKHTLEFVSRDGKKVGPLEIEMSQNEHLTLKPILFE